MSEVFTFEKGNFNDNYDNITTGPFIIAGKVDGHIYKNYESLLGREVSFKEHIKCMIEANAGAHYYAHGAYTCKYLTTKVLIDLQKLHVNRRDKSGNPCRNAYLCLGYISSGRYWHIDTGLCNNQEEDVWAAFLCDFGLGEPKEVSFADIAAFNTRRFPAARFFETEVDLSGCTDDSDVVVCIYRFLDDTRKSLGEITATMTKPAGEIFERENKKPKARMVRFMSLVPRTGRLEDDDADGTFLIASLEELSIDGAKWTQEYLDYVWSVQSSNIVDLQVSNLGNAPIGEDIDYISLNHKHQLS